MMQAIPIEQIRHRQDARHRDESALNALAESMGEIGLINPIRVRPVGAGLFEVVAGSHRLQAAELLEWPTISAFVASDDDLHAELAMIDENLVRAELSAVERAEQTARRKAIYLELHPETTHGGDRKPDQVANLATRSFASATASATGLGERTVRRDAERGEKVFAPTMDIIRGTALDTGTYLDKIKKIDKPSDQVKAARRDLAWHKKQERESASGIARRYQPAPPTELFERFCNVSSSITAIDVKAVIEGAGRQRSVLGQHASSVIEVMEQILEGLG